MNLQNLEGRELGTKMIQDGRLDGYDMSSQTMTANTMLAMALRRHRR